MLPKLISDLETDSQMDVHPATGSHVEEPSPRNENAFLGFLGIGSLTPHKCGNVLPSPGRVKGLLGPLGASRSKRLALSFDLISSPAPPSCLLPCVLIRCRQRQNVAQHQLDSSADRDDAIQGRCQAAPPAGGKEGSTDRPTRARAQQHQKPTGRQCASTLGPDQAKVQGADATILV